MRPCLDDEESFALVDGALSEKDAVVLRRHLEGCERCRARVVAMEKSLAVLGEEVALDPAKHADAVMAALDGVRVEAKPPRRIGRLVPIAMGALAAAAALVIGINVGRRQHEDGFVARGGAVVDAPIGRSVAVTVHALDNDVPRPLTNNAVVGKDTRFAASHRNTGSTHAYAMVFVVDAKRAVHWLYPAYESLGSDPASVSLAPTEGREAMMGTGASFDDLAPGPMEVITVLSREPIHVSRIERLPEPSLSAIEAALEGAEVRALHLEVSER